MCFWEERQLHWSRELCVIDGHHLSYTNWSGDTKHSKVTNLPCPQQTDTRNHWLPRTFSQHNDVPILSQVIRVPGPIANLWLLSLLSCFFASVPLGRGWQGDQYHVCTGDLRTSPFAMSGNSSGRSQSREGLGCLFGQIWLTCTSTAGTSHPQVIWLLYIPVWGCDQWLSSTYYWDYQFSNCFANL